tara:strand:- start:4535 stop:5638 length:1104 start_codon:yes stop_codon:yes gene_type:complete
MSYFSSLNSFKQAQTQIQQHSEDVETQNREAKAQGIEEKFEYVDKVMNSASGALGGLGGGFHIARRVYKKGVKVKNDALKAKQKAQDLKDQAEGNKPQEEQQTPDEEPKVEEPKQEMTGKGDDVETKSGNPLDEISEEDAQGMMDKQAPSEMTKEAPDAPTTAKPETDPEGEFPKAPEAPEPTTQAPEPKPQQPQQPTEETNIGKADDGSLRAKEQGNENVSQNDAKGDLNAQGDKIDDKPAGGEADHPAVNDNMVDGAEEKAVGGGVKDMVNTGMEKMGVDDSIKATVNSGMETAGEALDFLGPIGELVGAGIAIVGFFRDIFEHKKEKAEQAQALAPTIGVSSSGISMGSLQTSGTQSKQVGTEV